MYLNGDESEMLKRGHDTVWLVDYSAIICKIDDHGYGLNNHIRKQNADWRSVNTRSNVSDIYIVWAKLKNTADIAGESPEFKHDMRLGMDWAISRSAGDFLHSQVHSGAPYDREVPLYVEELWRCANGTNV